MVIPMAQSMDSLANRYIGCILFLWKFSQCKTLQWDSARNLLAGWREKGESARDSGVFLSEMVSSNRGMQYLLLFNCQKFSKVEYINAGLRKDTNTLTRRLLKPGKFSEWATLIWYDRRWVNWSCIVCLVFHKFCWWCRVFIEIETMFIAEVV